MSITIPADARFYAEIPLVPAQGSRFQPTGFPDLGAAEFQAPAGENATRRMLLVESAQSMANRLEEVCWDATTNDVVPCLNGLPYVRVENAKGEYLTSSIQEAHRLNSPYLLENKDQTFFDLLKQELGGLETGRVDLHQLGKVLYKYDPNSLIHGIFLAKKELAGGRLRLPRMLSAFIEAAAVSPAISGGVKRDDVDPTGKSFGKTAKEGFGHVPFARVEYTGEIRAYFAIDLAQLRAFQLGDAAERLLFALCLYKIRAFLDDGLRLRTACDLATVGDLLVKRPSPFVVPTRAQLEAQLPGLVAAAGFRPDPIQKVTFASAK
jgi:CRISPR-associated protein Csb1